MQRRRERSTVLLNAASLVVLSALMKLREAPVRRKGQVLLAVARATHEQLRIAQGMVAWRGLRAVPHVRALAPQMLAQIRDEAERVQIDIA